MGSAYHLALDIFWSPLRGFRKRPAYLLPVFSIMRAPLTASQRAWSIAQDFPEELFNPVSAQFTENCSKATR